MNLDGYIRVSKTGGRTGDTFISPAVQRDQIQGWAALRGVTITEWHEDLDHSGGKLNRPGLDAMLERVRTKQTDGVAVARLDRLSRAGVADALGLVEGIHGHGGQLAIVDLGIDPTTTMGEFAMTVLLALARMQRRQIAEGWAAATQRAVERGVHGHAPFGYSKPGKGVPLELDPDTGPLVTKVFELRAQGASYTQLARWLDTQTPPVRGTHWTRRAVEGIIANRAYLGEARYGQHATPGAHPALVGLDVFEAAGQARGLRPSSGEPALLSGLIRCAGCRHRMHAATVGQRAQKVYRCKRRHGMGECPAPASVTRALVDQLVTDRFLARYADVSVEGKLASVDLDATRKRLADAEAELEAYRDDTGIRDALLRLGEGHWQAGLSKRVDTVVEAQGALERARTAAIGIDLAETADVWPTLSVTERRRVLTEGIDAVFLRRISTPGRNILEPGRVLVMWRGEAPNDLPGPGLRVELRSLDW